MFLRRGSAPCKVSSVLLFNSCARRCRRWRCSGSLPKTGARYIERGAHSMLPRARGEKFSGVFQMVVELLARPDVVVWRAAV